MTKLRRAAQSAFGDTSLRLRAAWLYHGHGMTQNEVAARLGIGRSTTIRLLEDAKKRGEVRVWIEEGEAELVELALQIETALSLDEVIVVPASDNFEQAARSVGLALGKFLSETITDNMTVGVGWGRTLTASLASFHPPRRAGVKVMSLLGGSVETRFANPVEFAWRIANAFSWNDALRLAVRKESGYSRAVGIDERPGRDSSHRTRQAGGLLVFRQRCPAQNTVQNKAQRSRG